MYNFYSQITNELNLNLPKKEIENPTNNDKYLDFIYYYIKLHMFFNFLNIMIRRNMTILFNYIIILKNFLSN